MQSENMATIHTKNTSQHQTHTSAAAASFWWRPRLTSLPPTLICDFHRRVWVCQLTPRKPDVPVCRLAKPAQTLSIFAVVTMQCHRVRQHRYSARANEQRDRLTCADAAGSALGPTGVARVRLGR